MDETLDLEFESLNVENDTLVDGQRLTIDDFLLSKTTRDSFRSALGSKEKDFDYLIDIVNYKECIGLENASLLIQQVPQDKNYHDTYPLHLNMSLVS